MSRKSLRIIQVLSILSAILVVSTYVTYYTVASADFLSSNVAFEAFDQEYLLVANQSRLKVSPLIDFLGRFRLATCALGLPFFLSSQIFSLEQMTLVLRC